MTTIKGFPKRIYSRTQTFSSEVPSIAKTHHFINDTINFLFPIRAEKNTSLAFFEAKWEDIQSQFEELLKPLQPLLPRTVKELAVEFFSTVSSIYDNLIKDAEAYLNFDPAAKSPEEVILCYPGYYALSIYRLSHVLYTMNIPVLPRIISEYAHTKTGIDIHPGAKISHSFFIDHGTGIVIGETTIIGNNVKIYQGVTLGALYVGKELTNVKRHPTIEDNVIIYAGSTILGGQTIIGHDTVVGGNSWITESVPAFSVVYHKPSIVIRDSKKFVEPINFVM